MSGLVELGVMVARSASLRIGDMAFPDPFISGPTTATTPAFATSFLALAAAWAGSYCPAAAVASSRMASSILYPATPPLAFASSLASTTPSLINSAPWASAPVSGRITPTYSTFGAAWDPRTASSAARVTTRLRLRASHRARRGSRIRLGRMRSPLLKQDLIAVFGQFPPRRIFSPPGGPARLHPPAGLHIILRDTARGIRSTMDGRRRNQMIRIRRLAAAGGVAGLLAAVGGAGGGAGRAVAAGPVAAFPIVAAQTAANGEMNYDGTIKGQLVITVPVGAAVQLTLTNKGTLPHSLQIIPFTDQMPAAAVPIPAFPGAPTKDPQAGI